VPIQVFLSLHLYLLYLLSNSSDGNDNTLTSLNVCSLDNVVQQGEQNSDHTFVRTERIWCINPQMLTTAFGD